MSTVVAIVAAVTRPFVLGAIRTSTALATCDTSYVDVISSSGHDNIITESELVVTAIWSCLCCVV